MKATSNQKRGSNHVSEWHVLDPADRNTYPTVEGPLQVQYEDGRLAEGVTHIFFPGRNLLANGEIARWRYIKDLAIR